MPTVEQLQSQEACWRGSDLAASPSIWRHELVEEEIEELTTLAARLANVTAGDLPSLKVGSGGCVIGPWLSKALVAWNRAIADTGRGFQVIRGTPVHAWNNKEQVSSAVFWCLGLHLGQPGAQNNEGQLLGHVIAEHGVDVNAVRLYRTSEPIDFHCDIADVVGLFCLTAAPNGQGASRIASTVTVFAEIMQQYPAEVVQFLLNNYHYLDTRGTGGISYIPAKPVAWSDSEKVLRSNHHSEYYNTSRRHPLTPPFTGIQEQALRAYADVLKQPGLALSIDFLPGDIQLVNNHLLVHARDGYSDIEGLPRRHLLRLWLSHNFPSTAPWQAKFERGRALLSVLYRLASQKIIEKF